VYVIGFTTVVSVTSKTSSSIGFVQHKDQVPDHSKDMNGDMDIYIYNGFITCYIS